MKRRQTYHFSIVYNREANHNTHLIIKQKNGNSKGSGQKGKEISKQKKKQKKTH